MPTSPRTSSALRRRPLRARWLLPLVVAVSSLSSCGVQAHSSAHTSDPQAQAGNAIGSALERRGGPASHLLGAARMPTTGTAWSATDTVSKDLSVLVPCHVTSLVDIGALAAVRRSWSSASPERRAVQVVARFADGRSAWRAHQVLGSWREDCAARERVEVGPLRGVTVSTGVGQAFRVGSGTDATDVGILRKGSYLSVVTLLDPDLPADPTLAKTAVRRIAATF